jgi:hypothetical protein
MVELIVVTKRNGRWQQRTALEDRSSVFIASLVCRMVKVVSLKRQTVVKQMAEFLYSVLMLITNYSAECRIWGSHSRGYNAVSSSLAKEPFLRHSLPQEILPHCIRFAFLWISQYYFLFYSARSSALRPSPNPEDQVPVFISPNNRAAQLHPQALGSLFVASYDSQVFQPASTHRTRSESTHVSEEHITCFHASFFLAFFDPEDGGDMFSETFIDSQRITRRYVSKIRTMPYLS